MTPPQVLLVRTDSGDHGTFGVLVAGAYACQCAEPPWRNNQKGLSAIPAGSYRCTWHRSPRYGWGYWVRNVPGRAGILLHAGNLAGDRTRGLATHTEGCILPGTYRGHLAGQRAVLASRTALNNLLDAVGCAATLELTILEGYHA